jgi:Xaa-Pro aminopeptidase
MDAYARETRKIDPSKPATRPDGTPLDPDRVETGPTDLAFAEWAAAGLTPPDLAEMRAYRHRRLVEHIVARDLAGLLLFDPLNIRYATDCPNMQLWNTHNPFRALLVTPDGHMVLWEYKGASYAFLTSFNPLVKEVRGGASMFYFSTGDRGEDAARTFVAEVDALLRERSPGNRRLAVDKIMISGYRALTAAGIEVHEGEELTEKARSVKGPDEILAMRCAIHACETAVAAMERAAAPGLSEDEIWAVLHAENIRRGGEWIETRLLASGPRTNPWFQECGPRIVQPNEVLAFDTDLVGCYGLCTDISRTWWIGDDDPPAEVRRQFQLGHQHIMENIALIGPGEPFRDHVFKGHQLPEEFLPGRYGCRMHGVGLCDEWPSIAYPQDYVEGAFEYVCEPGMMLCVEALIQTRGGDFAIKLEDQVLVTETGVENLTSYPFDARLMA